uniref:Uncharacterized protein n=1 Tax=Opuntia streptacantha TaxID=393608 RepID=A0A7C9A4D8_OPUST
MAFPLAIIKKRCEVLFSRGFTQGLFLWNTEEKILREIEVPIVHYSQVTVCEDSLAPLAHSLMLWGKETTEEKRHYKEEENQMKQGRNKKKHRYDKNILVS